MARSGEYGVISVPHISQFFQHSHMTMSSFLSECSVFLHRGHLPSYFAMFYTFLSQVNVVDMLVIFPMALLRRIPTPNRVVARTPYLPFLTSSQSSTIISLLRSITDATRVAPAQAFP